MSITAFWYENIICDLDPTTYFEFALYKPLNCGEHVFPFMLLRKMFYPVKTANSRHSATMFFTNSLLNQPNGTLSEKHTKGQTGPMTPTDETKNNND